MPNSYRIRTQVGVDKSVTVKLDQDFDFLEILSLKITQSDIYTRACSDYGVVVGRVVVNDGYGLQNAKVSIFIPLSGEDELDPIISTLYPYKTITDVNDEGYRYNLLPYVQSYSFHTPTGTFPDRQDVLLNKSLIEVYDKYYKFTVKTNSSGDFMIFGVPTGPQLLFMDIDLSDIGEFSLTPQDMVRLGLANEGQFNGLKFRSSSNLYSLPQIVSMQSQIEVMPLWGDPQICQLSITRNDFDLAEIGINLQPTAIFMGSLISTSEKYAVKRYNFSQNLCKVRIKTGELCRLVTGPGEIVAIRQTILNDSLGRPILEQYQLESAGKVIDENGTWLIDLPMNMDYVYTDEFGNQVLSNDPTVGVPTTGKYRFKIKWEQPTNQNNEIQRGYFLVPNIKEWGWKNSTNDPNAHQEISGGSSLGAAPIQPVSFQDYVSLQANYAFSLDWNDYGDPNDTVIAAQQINEAISCVDRFYIFNYNKVYTVSQFIDQYRGGRAARKFNSIKNILDDVCEETINPFPANEAQFRGDLLYLLFTIFLRILTPVFIVVLIIQHILAFLLYLLSPIIYFTALIVGYVNYGICKMLNFFRHTLFRGQKHDCKNPNEIKQEAKDLANLYKKFTNFPLANLTYPDCEMCNCKIGSAKYEEVDPNADQLLQYQSSVVNNSTLSDWNVDSTYDLLNDHIADTPVDPSVESYWPAQSFSEYATIVMAGFPFSAANFDLNYNVLDANACLKDFSTVVKSEKILFTYNACCTQGGSAWTNNKHYRDRKWFTPSLTMAERINLFNTKAKYFNTSALGGSPYDGGTANFAGQNSGVNQIRVRFNSPMNTGPIQYHLDNVMILSCDPGTLSDFQTGSIVFFNGFENSKDVNALSASTNNDLGIPSITGRTTVPQSSFTGNNALHTVTVSYADPDNPNLSAIKQINYKVYVNKDDTDYHRWPIDIEYFQVITAMTVGSFLSYSNPSAPKNSFPKRFLDNKISMYKQAQGQYGYGIPTYVLGELSTIYEPFVFADWPRPTNNGNQCTQLYSGYSPQWKSAFKNYCNPISGTSNGSQHVIVILVRGVDPYSTRNVNEYDLSKIFGYGFGNIKITGKYKLNIPIQPVLKNAKHDQLPFNTSVSTYSNTSIFYDTYYYVPGTQFSSFTSNLLSYYSNVDSNTCSVNPYGAYPSPTWFSYTNTLTNDLRIKGYSTSQLPPAPGSSPSNANLSFPQPQSSVNYMTTDFTYKIFPTASAIERGCIFGNVNKKYGFEADGMNGAVDNLDIYNINNSSSVGTRGYYRNESVEGGSFLALDIRQTTGPNASSNVYGDQLGYFCPTNSSSCAGSPNNIVEYRRYKQDSLRGYHYSFKYDNTTVNTTYLSSNKRKIVMRTDRLPTSSNVLTHQYNSYVLHHNPAFSIYTSDDDANLLSVPNVTIGFNDNLGDESSGITVSAFSSVINSTNECSEMLPLKCYYTNSNDELQLDPDLNSDRWNGTCTTFTALSKTRPIFDVGVGCYLLVTRPILSIKVDLILLLEWKSRLDLTFGACRNVFSHIFTNNWINGTLYAYSFKNDVLFTSPFDPNGNQPVVNYCYDTIYFHPTTQNYYYRSSPYNPNSDIFIGKSGSYNLTPSGSGNRYGGNKKYIGNPTTIIDLGSRAPYMSSLVNNNRFDVYNIDNVTPTTFREDDDLINIFILSRLLNANFWNLLFGSNGAAIFGLFSRVNRSLAPNPLQKNFVDGDFAQLVSINSEIGVRGFDSDNVGALQNPVIVQLGTNSKETIIGVYYDADLQIRDFVSPYRKIYNNNTIIGNPSSFDTISIGFMTQVVPYYGWMIRKNTKDTIFGVQQNDWDTSAIKALPYQRQDRTNLFQIPLQTSPFNSGQILFNYMQSKDFASILTQYYKGFIYAAKAQVVPPFRVTNTVTDVYISPPLSEYTQIFQVGAPFHFYFGLIKGSTAYDRFRTKWIEGETV